MARFLTLYCLLWSVLSLAWTQINEAPAQVLSITPANNATGVPIGTTIEILFSEPMEPPRQGYSTVDPFLSPLYQQGSNLPVPGTLEPLGNGERWRFRPAQPLNYNTQYEIRLANWFTYRYDRAQQRIGLAPGQQLFRFTTEPEPDRTPPRVVRFTPSNGQQNVPITQEIEVEFSEPMAPYNTYEARHTTLLLLNGQPVPGTLTPNAQRTVWRFRPQRPLNYGTVYTIEVSGWVDEAWNPVQPPTSAQFTTEPEPDRTPPRVTRFFPDNGQSGVPLDVGVVVEFSEPIRPRATAGAGSILFEGTTAVAGQLFVERARLRFRPAQPLKAGTVYRIEVGNYEDEAGNPVAPPTSASFTTLVPPPTTQPFRLLSSSVPDGATNQPLQPRIELRFNLALEGRSLSATLRSERAQFPIQIQPLTPQSVVIVPQSPLPGGTAFTLDFSAFRGVGGEGAPEPSQIRFTTEIEVDRTPPRVVTSNPTRDASGVSIQPVITVSFDERVRSARPLGSVVRDPRSGQFLTGALTLQPDGRTLVFQLARPLDPLTRYEIVLEGLTDEAGNPVNERDRVLAFTTGAGVSRQVQLIDPPAGASIPPERSPRFRWTPQLEVRGYILVITAQPLSGRTLLERATLRGPARDPFGDTREAVARVVITNGATGEAEIPSDQWARIARLQNARLFWTVRAITAEGQTAGDEATQSESRPLLLGKPAGIQLVTPLPNAVVPSLLPSFQWRAEGAIELYRFVIRSADGRTVYEAELREQALTYDELAPQPLRNNQQYLWQVVGLNRAGQPVAESEVRAFQTPAQQVVPIRAILPGPNRPLRSRLPFFVWEPTEREIERHRLQVFQTGSDSPLYEVELSGEEARLASLPAEFALPDTVLRTLYPDEAPRMSPEQRYQWRVEGYRGEELVAASERTAFNFIEDRFIPILSIQDLQILVNGAPAQTYPAGGWGNLPAVFVKPGDRVSLRGRIVNTGEGAAVNVPVRVIVDTLRANTNLPDLIVPEPRLPTNPFLQPAPPRTAPRSHLPEQEGDYGDLLEQVQPPRTIPQNLQSSIQLEGFQVPSSILPNLQVQSVRIARIEPGGAAEFELPYTVPRDVMDGKGLPVVALVGERTSALKQGYLLVNVLGFDFVPDTPTAFQQGQELKVAGRIRWQRPDYLPGDPLSETVSIPAVVTLSREGRVSEARLSQATNFSLYRFEAVLRGAVATETQKLSIQGIVRVPVRGSSPLEVPFGTAIPLATPIAQASGGTFADRDPRDEPLGGGEPTQPVRTGGTLSNTTAFLGTNLPLTKQKPGPFDTQALAPRAFIPLGDVLVSFPPFVLNHRGEVIQGEINVAAPPGNRLSVRLSGYQTPEITLEPERLRLSSAGLRIDGLTRDRYILSIAEGAPGTSSAAAAVINLTVANNTSHTITYSAEQLERMTTRWWEQIDQVYPTFVAFNWWRQGDQRFWSSELAVGTVNLGGYIPTNLNFNPAEWYPDLFPLQINPVFVAQVGGVLSQSLQEAGRRVGAHTPLAEPPLNLPITRPQSSQVPALGGGRSGDSRSRGVQPDPSVSLPGIGMQGLPTPSRWRDIMGSLAMPRFDAPSNPGNNVNPNAVNMANLPIFYRELILTPKRQIQQGEIRLAYDMGVVSSGGFRANNRRMRPVSENDVGGRFFVGDFEFRRSPNPGWTFTLPGNVPVEVDLSGVSFSPEMLADGTRWRAVGGTITPRLPAGGLRYTYAGFTLVLSQIRFELSPADQRVKLEGAIELPEAFTQAMGSTERGRINFRDVVITANGTLDGEVSFEGIGFNLGMFRLEGPAGSLIDIEKGASDTQIRVTLRNLHLQLPNPVGGGVSTLTAEQISVSNQGISGTVSFNSPITVGEAGFGFTLNGGTVVFENTQVSLSVNELRFHLPSVPDPITLLNTALSMADPSQWQFYFPLEGSQIPTLNLSNDPQVRVTIPDESGADLILDLSTSQSPPGKPNDWRGVWIRRAQVQIGNEEGMNLTLAGEGLEIGSGGFTGTLSATLSPPFEWGVGGFQLRFESAQARFESNTLAELTLPNAQLTLPGIGDIPIQNLVARSGSPLRLVSGVMSGTHTVQLFGFPLTIQNAGFTETGFRIERASLALSEGRTVEVTNLFVDGNGNLSGSLSFTGPVNFNLIDTGAYQVQVRLDNAELSGAGLRVNGQVRIPIPEALRPLKPESWPEVLEANFNDVVFSAEPRVVSGRIAFTVGTEEIAVIDASGVRVNLASALPAVGQNLQVGPFTVRLDSLSASTQNFLSVSGQATLILPAGVPITPNEIQFAFENLQLGQEGGNWRVTLGQFRISAPDPSTAVRLSLPGGFGVAVKRLVLAPNASDCQFEFWLELPSGLPITVADGGGRTLGVTAVGGTLPARMMVATTSDPVRLLMGLTNFSPESVLYLENIEVPDLNLPGGMRAEQIRAVIDFTDGRSPSGKPNDWKGILISSGRLRLPDSLGADRAVQFTNLAIGSDGLSGELSLNMDPPLQFGGDSVGGFTLRLTSGTLRFLPAPDYAELSVSGGLSFPRSLAPEGSNLDISTQIRFTGGTPRLYATLTWTGEIPLVAGMALRSASGGTTIVLDFDSNRPDSEPDRSFVGVKISAGSIRLPQPFNEGECAFTNLVLGNNGFSGTLELRAPFSYRIPFGSEEFRMEFQSGSITLTESRITNATLNGNLAFPSSFQRATGAFDPTRPPVQVASLSPFESAQSDLVRLAFENLTIDMSGGEPRFGLLIPRATLPPIRFAGFELDFGSGDTGGIGVDLSPFAGIEGFTSAEFLGVVLYQGAFRTPPLIGDQRIGFAYNRLIIGTSGLSGTLSIEQPLNFDLPFIQGAAIELTAGSLTFDRNRVTEFTLGGGLRLPTEFRLPDGNVVRVAFSALRINMQGEFSIEGVRLPPITVGGFTVSANEIAVDASRSWTPNNQLGLGPTWRGVYILGGRVIFPTSLYADASGNPLTVEIFSAVIGDTGRISADVRLVSEVRFDLRGANGMAIGLTSARAVIRDNQWREASFSGYIQLPNNVENVNAPGTPVRLTFHNAAFKANGEFFVEVSLDRCRIYGFEVAIQRLTFDYDTERTPTIQVGNLLDDAPRAPPWKGVYVEGGFLKLPPSLARAGAEPPSVRVQHLFVDGSGITGRASFDAGGNLAGAIGGFAFDLREFSLGLRRNSIVEGGAVVGVSIEPLTRPGEKISIEIRFAESGFTVAVRDVPPINVQNVAILRLQSVAYTSEGGGKLIVSGSLEVRPLNATAQFTNLGISSQGIEGEIWIVPNSPLNASFQGFGVALREIGLGTRGGRFFIGVGGDLTISVSDFSVTAGTRLAFFLDGGVDIDRIALDFTWKDFIQVGGEVQFRQEGQAYDFYGRVTIRIKMGGGAVGIEADVRIGRTPQFGYFGFSAVVTLPTPIQLGTLPIGLFEFGGGLAINLSYTPGQAITQGSPQPNAYAFQATVGICTMDRYLLHGRVTLTVAIAGGALSSISLQGTFYLLANPMERPDNRKIVGLIAYNHTQTRFTASLTVSLAIDAGGRQIVQVNGGSSLVISRTEFLISIGTASQKVSARVLGFISASGYLTIGSEGGRFRIETALSAGYDFGIASASLNIAFWFRTNPFEVGGCIGASASLLGIGVSGQGCISCCPLRIKLELCVNLLFDDACIGFNI